jgi:hypothetical protein
MFRVENEVHVDAVLEQELFMYCYVMLVSFPVS